MNTIDIYRIKRSVTVFVFVFCLLTNVAAAGDKLKPEEIIVKHLESIGSAEARAAIKSITVIGTARATFFGRGGGIAEGITVLASKDNKYMVAMKFNNSDYQFEKLGYDTEDFTVGYVSPGKRSVLGDFLRVNKNTFERGIMSGVLSTAWELLDTDNEKAKIKYSGMEKIDDKKYHELSYNPRKGSDLSIKLYFDPETFRHVRTEYKRTISSRQGTTVDTSAGQSETRYKLVEDFADFKEEKKLTLPHSYKLFLEILSGNGTISYEWQMNLEKFNFNQPIDDADFKVDAY